MSWQSSFWCPHIIHSLSIPSASFSFMWGGQTVLIFIGRAFGQCHRSYGQVSQATSVFLPFLFFQGGSWILQTRHWTEVNCSDLREHNTCILQTWTAGTCGSFLCVWYWSRQAVGLEWIQTIRWYWSKYAYSTIVNTLNSFWTLVSQ